MYDYYYIALVLPMIIFSIIASIMVKRTFKKNSSFLNSRGLTGAQAVYQMLQHYGITDVKVERIAGNLSDHYDPRTNIIRLSDNVFDSTSVAAVGVACHEAGHAVQYAKGYLPIKIRNVIYPVVSFGSKASWPLILIGLFLGFGPLIFAGIIFFAFATLFEFITLPVEFNASKRATEAINQLNLLNDEEGKAAKKVLSSAALTYVASAAVSLANLLRLLLKFSRRR
jgi:Zn-dependent membrane protease YugP